MNKRINQFKIIIVVTGLLVLNTIYAMDEWNRDRILKNGAKENAQEVYAVHHQLLALYNCNKTVLAELIAKTHDPSHELSDNAHLILAEYRMLPGNDHGGRVMKNTILSAFPDNPTHCPMLTLDSFEVDPFENNFFCLTA
jgi:hypothetical protein